MKNKKLHSYPIIIAFVLFIWVVLVASILIDPQDYNSKEEKELAQMPDFIECTSIADFASKWDAFVSDQFPLRSWIIGTKQDIDIGEDDIIVDDIYVLSSDYLFTYTWPTQNKDVQCLMEAIANKREESKLLFTYIIVPQKNLVIGEQEESIDITIDEDNTKRITTALDAYKIPKINCCDYLRSFPLEERAKFFYKTDFHWNEYGAYKAADYIAKNLAATKKIKASSVPSEEDFIWTDLTGRGYLGDLQKRFSDTPTVEEYIPFYIALDGESFIYHTSLDGEEVPRGDIVASGLDSDLLDYNKISTYNSGYLRVENPNADEKKSILILKDSYECCLTDYFSQIYSEINIVDPRFEGPSFDEIVEARDIDYVLCLYHNSNASQDLIRYLGGTVRTTK